MVFVNETGLVPVEGVDVGAAATATTSLAVATMDEKDAGAEGVSIGSEEHSVSVSVSVSAGATATNEEVVMAAALVAAASASAVEEVITATWLCLDGLRVMVTPADVLVPVPVLMEKGAAVEAIDEGLLVADADAEAEAEALADGCVVPEEVPSHRAGPGMI